VKRNAGFTLIEIYAVIGMIAILAAILFPVFTQARAKARASSCASNLSEICLALQMYAEDWGGGYPPQEDNLVTIARQTKVEYIFRCPAWGGSFTEHEQGLLEKARKKEFINPSEFNQPLPTGPNYGLTPIIADDVVLGSSYYYHAGLTNEAAGNELLAAERMTLHNDGANVLYASGRVKWLRQEQWNCLVPAAGKRPPEDVGSFSSSGGTMVPDSVPSTPGAGKG